MKEILEKVAKKPELRELFEKAKEIVVPKSREHLLELSMGGYEDVFEIGYPLSDGNYVREATVTKVKNGVVVNYDEPYMRRRDPKCMLVSNFEKTDKERYEERYGKSFSGLRKETFDWLSGQELIVMPFAAGGYDLKHYAVLIAPKNAAFFAAGLADLQYFIPGDEIPEDYDVEAIFYLAPPFRHTHFEGKQMVIHHREDDIYEMFAYNLYPGPSAKKGAYGLLLDIGEREGWTTLHSSAVSVITPYDNILTIMHEGASGGGKSEMAEKIHRDEEGVIQVAKHKNGKDGFAMTLRESCEIRPITDDMALCHSKFQGGKKKLVVRDAENGWFLRTDGITSYGTDPYLERLTIHPQEPLIFLNFEASVGSTCLLWEHIEDSPGVTCPNPRVIMPRRFIPKIIDDPVEIDVRSFGVRVPYCTKEDPSYGIIGLMHMLPPALAWLWRLVSPRGFANPSITDEGGMKGEGVGSYWPFATGKRVAQANLLLKQFVDATETRYILFPNQHIGAYEVGFMPEWVSREFLARRGSASFREDMLVPAKAPILGYALDSMKIDGTYVPKGLLQVDQQAEVGEEAYMQGAKELIDFFKQELKVYLTEDLEPLGRQIIECFLNDGKLEEYLGFIPMKF